MGVGASSPSIALCLSGGGLRATLFHVGVLRALRSYRIGGEIALRRVREVYAVSGGSIAAAHFLANYDRYVGEDAEFDAATADVLALARRDVRNRVLRRWGLTWWCGGTRAFWLEREYRRLLEDVRISSCYSDGSRPTFHFLTTNFNTGELCSFSRTSFEKTKKAGEALSTDAAAAGGVRLALAVAASSSFPPMFPPVKLTPAMLGFPADAEFDSAVELSDGGVYDNFGIDKFRIARRAGPVPDMLIASHAGGSFDTTPDKRYGSMLSRNVRASDIMMRRVGEATLAAGASVGGDGFTLIRIGETVDDGTVEVATQQQLRLVRTDLDGFGRDLGRLLVDHGSRVACQALDGRGWERASRISFMRDEGRKDELDAVVRKAAHRGYWSLILDFRDFGWLLAWWTLALAAAALAVFSIAAFVQAKKEERRLSISRTAALNTMEKQLEAVRSAAVTGDVAKIRRTLAVAITTSQAIGNDPDAAQQTQVPRLGSAQVGSILDSPVVPSLQTTRFRQTVFLQFAGTLTRSEITGLNAALKAAGWNVAGDSGERLPAAAGLHEVRYSGDNLQAAQELAAAVNSSGLATAPVVPREMSIIGDHTLEIWMSK